MRPYWFQRLKKQVLAWFGQVMARPDQPNFQARFKACPSCGRFVDVGDSICEYCQGHVGHIQVSSTRFEVAGEGKIHLESTYAVFGLCTFFFVLSAVLSGQDARMPGEEFSLLDHLKGYLMPANGKVFVALGALVPFNIHETGEYWRFFTYMFLHGNVLHIIMNLSALAFLGPLVFSLFGLRRFWLLCLGCGAAGGLLSLVINGFLARHHLGSQGMTVGLSAALFGFLGAVYSYYRYSGDLGAAEKFRNAMVWGNALCLAITLLGLAVDNAAHLGGMFLGIFWGRQMFLHGSTRLAEKAERLLLLVLLLVWIFGSFQVLLRLVQSLEG